MRAFVHHVIHAYYIHTEGVEVSRYVTPWLLPSSVEGLFGMKAAAWLSPGAPTQRSTVGVGADHAILCHRLSLSSVKQIQFKSSRFHVCAVTLVQCSFQW